MNPFAVRRFNRRERLFVVSQNWMNSEAGSQLLGKEKDLSATMFRRENPSTNSASAFAVVVAIVAGCSCRHCCCNSLGSRSLSLTWEIMGLPGAIKSQSVSSANPDGTTQSDDDFFTYAVISTNLPHAGSRRFSL